MKQPHRRSSLIPAAADARVGNIYIFMFFSIWCYQHYITLHIFISPYYTWSLVSLPTISNDCSNNEFTSTQDAIPRTSTPLPCRREITSVPWTFEEAAYRIFSENLIKPTTRTPIRGFDAGAVPEMIIAAHLVGDGGIRRVPSQRKKPPKQIGSLGAFHAFTVCLREFVAKSFTVWFWLSFDLWLLGCEKYVE